MTQSYGRASSCVGSPDVKRDAYDAAAAPVTRRVPTIAVATRGAAKGSMPSVILRITPFARGPEIGWRR